ncbi:myosin-1-like [Zingiber officinale]|uniref:myosin-1-like n=1 Tax=Zingiber officinale TaxID=94328 RepID=UPI001C4D6479|nr:myosin-1-like [Zingiber officinale]
MEKKCVLFVETGGSPKREVAGRKEKVLRSSCLFPRGKHRALINSKRNVIKPPFQVPPPPPPPPPSSRSLEKSGTSSAKSAPSEAELTDAFQAAGQEMLRQLDDSFPIVRKPRTPRSKARSEIQLPASFEHRSQPRPTAIFLLGRFRVGPWAEPTRPVLVYDYIRKLNQAGRNHNRPGSIFTFLAATEQILCLPFNSTEKLNKKCFNSKQYIV